MASRRPLVAGNWKMNHGVAQTLAWLSHAETIDWPDVDSVEVAIAPPAISLSTAATKLGVNGSLANLRLAAQSVHEQGQGAFTGEISAPMVAELGVRYVLVGHSERRQYFGESDELVAKKARAILSAGMSPIVCVGEPLEVRERGSTMGWVGDQVRRVFSELVGGGWNDAIAPVVAYEPIWAIGTGKTATPEQAQEVHLAIRSLLRAICGERGDSLRILYGGSVNRDNARALLGQPDVDGALVGGASLKPDEFAVIARSAQ